MKDINLMPKYALSKKENKNLLKIGLMLMIITIMVSVVLDFGEWYANVFYANKIEQQKVKINQLLGADSDLGALNTVGLKITYRNNVLKNIDKNRSRISKFINTIQKLAPNSGANGLFLNNIDIDSEGKVTLQGKSNKEEDILDLYHSLKASNVGDYIEITQLDGALGGNEFNFTFSFKLK